MSFSGGAPSSTRVYNRPRANKLREGLADCLEKIVQNEGGGHSEGTGAAQEPEREG